MNSIEADIVNAVLLGKAKELKESLQKHANWCDASEIGRYTLDMIIGNLDPDQPTDKLLR